MKTSQSSTKKLLTALKKGQSFTRGQAMTRFGFGSKDSVSAVVSRLINEDGHNIRSIPSKNASGTPIKYALG